MTEVTRHFTATTFIVRDGAVLLHLHTKQQLWLPPGGHLERDELPHEAALREIEEETGLTVQLHSEFEAVEMSRQMECQVMPQPAFILVEDINAFHQHIDFTYFALADEESAAVTAANGFRWLAPDELVMDAVPVNVRVGAERAVAYFRETGGHRGWGRVQERRYERIDRDKT